MKRAEKLLDDAREVLRDRHATYGPPQDHFTRTVGAINALFRHKLTEPLTVADWAQIMLVDKLSRNQGPSKKSDTPIDLVGYACCLAEVDP